MIPSGYKRSYINGTDPLIPLTAVGYEATAAIQKGGSSEAPGKAPILFKGNCCSLDSVVMLIHQSF